MCIIACKPIGLQLPDEDTIENMWFSNPDGAGLMYAHNGKVHIEKGFMDIDEFLKALKRIDRAVNLTDCGVVMHFRITTHGGTAPANTHPFPISSNMASLKKLKLSTDVGVAHNGIIHNIPRSKDISDTMEYIVSQLAPLKAALPKFWENKNAMLLVKNAIDSKMAFLTADGNIHTIGDFTEHDGILYSNTSYKGYYYKWTSYYGSNTRDGKWDSKVYDIDRNKSLVPYSDDYYDDYAFGYDSYADDDLITLHPLMPITDVDGAFYTTTKGEELTDNNYDLFLDTKGRVWELDSYAGIAYLDDTVTGVYDALGMRLRYDYNLAEYIHCYDYNDTTGCYTPSDKEGK